MGLRTFHFVEHKKRTKYSLSNMVATLKTLALSLRISQFKLKYIKKNVKKS